jgi:hypothetical protein
MRMSLAGNYGAPTDLLERLAHDDPGLADVVANNPNAPVDMKEAVPFWQHSHLSLLRYGQQTGLTGEQTDALHARLSDTQGGEDPATLGEVAREMGLRP